MMGRGVFHSIFIFPSFSGLQHLSFFTVTGNRCWLVPVAYYLPH
jgi:hypothetical protein